MTHYVHALRLHQDVANNHSGLADLATLLRDCSGAASPTHITKTVTTMSRLRHDCQDYIMTDLIIRQDCPKIFDR